MKIGSVISGLAVLLLPLTPVYSQPVETTYLGTIIKEGAANDVAYGPYDIGFPFTFYGTVYTQFHVSTNGLVTFGSGSTSNAETNIPSATLPDNFIAAFWDDLKIDGFGSISYAVIGAAPNRKLVIQFRNMGFYPSPTYMGTFSVLLYETSNIIQTQYRMIVLQDVTRATGGDAAFGVENDGGTSGVEFAHHDPAAVNSWKAISYTPSGVTYIANGDAVYEGIYLTKNLTVPEPGITDLISPANGSTVGTDVTFQWGTSDYATKYYLRVAENPEMTAATTYYSGTDLSFTKTGLVNGTTYYWTILAYNTTGYTWNEVKKFTVSTTPPLTAVPQTVWTEQGADKTITLNYTGGDASAKTAIITSLPAQGQLFQYNAGIKGPQITTVPETVSDAGRNVIYTAPAASGNGIGNFKFKMNDGTGDSPEATITVNVSPPGIPNVLAVARGTGVEIQFDRKMADPSGKQSQFTVTVNGTPATLTSASLKTGDPYTIVLTPETALTGTETILVSYTQGDIVTTQGGVLLSFTDTPVTLLSQTINFTQSLDKKFNESPFNLTATASSSLSLTYSSSNTSVASVSGSAVTLVNIGTTEITARQAGNATYAPARYIRTLTVTKGDQTITFGSLADKTFGDSDFTLSATSSSGLTVSYSSSNTDVVTVTGNLVHITGAGPVTITASQAGDAKWNAATDVPQTFTVQKADQTITFDPLTLKTFGDADFALSATSASGLTVAFTSGNTDIATITGNMVHIVGAGDVVITAEQSGNTNWNAAPQVQQTLSVQKADQSITFGSLPAKTFGDADFALSATSGSGLTVAFTSGNTAIATITGNMVHIVGAGDVVITAEQSGNTNWNAAPQVQQTLSVQKADQSITFGSLPAKTFGDADFALSATSGSGLTVAFTSGNTDIATITGNMVHIVGAGDVVITAEQSGNTNWNAAPQVPQTLSIEKADQTITFGSLPAKTFGDADFALSATSGSGLTVAFTSGNTAIATITGNMVHIVGAGDVVITAEQSGNTNWNAAPQVPQTLSIGKADQTISFSSLPLKTFGDADFTISATSGSGLAVTFASDNTDVATVTGNTVHITGGGAAVITATQNGNTNWNSALPVNQTLTIQKADQTITFGPLADKFTSDPDFNPGASSSSGLTIAYSSDNPSVATILSGMIHVTGEGSALITASQAGNDDYNAATDVSQLLQVLLATGIENPLSPVLNPSVYLSGDWISIEPKSNTWTRSVSSVRVYSPNGNIITELPDIYFNLDSPVKIKAPAITGLYFVEIRSGINRYVAKIVKK